MPHFQMRIAEDAIGMTIGRIECDCLGGLLGCSREVVPGIEDESQVTQSLAILRTELQRLP